MNPADSTIGQAQLVQRRRGFPARVGWFWDCTPYGGGFIRKTDAPGAAVINDGDGTLVDMRSGRVYIDKRFRKEEPC